MRGEIQPSEKTQLGVAGFWVEVSLLGKTGFFADEPFDETGMRERRGQIVRILVDVVVEQDDGSVRAGIPDSFQRGPGGRLILEHPPVGRDVDAPPCFGIGKQFSRLDPTMTQNSSELPFGALETTAGGVGEKRNIDVGPAEDFERLPDGFDAYRFKMGCSGNRDVSVRKERTQPAHLIRGRS